ncbi:ADP-glyceromanno-heptose 6-epimerase [Phaeovibrio sulfidiphilus]|uniref:ADP-L-glycero-D-manno-heptose-6-epimerase n=1 Tax=Phaeovibrio sulfidiphilus TaxID=1220600 RepID=A0A8J6YXV6_9PROT|nr:ADP-glyceromanno-heptose 6-epimerase [Phaeovibrio sulfidiphilus]MBE1237677.1 ADP-glyceromanno-heptose 6-epimerase [Phaeovibrio sulfidiphilus]
MFIITGAAGMIGSALLWELNNRGIDEIIVVDQLGTSDQWKNLVKRQFLGFVDKDVFLEHVNRNAVEDLIIGEFGRGAVRARLEGIAHLGACSSTTERDADYLIRNNLNYSKALATYAMKKGVRFVNASSAATYGDGEAGFDDDRDRLDELRPLNMYGYSKHLFDVWAQRTGAFAHLASIKFFNVFGPNEYHKEDMRSLVNKAVPQILEGGRLKLFRSYREDFPDGGQKRDFVYVKDCARVLADLLLEARGVNGLFNLGSGQARSWNDLAAAVFAAMDRPVAIDYIEMPEILRGKYQYFTEAPMDRLRSALERCGSSFQPTSLEDAVSDYVRSHLLQDDPYL